MFFYILIIISLLILFFILYIFHSNRKGKHKKSTTAKIQTNYYNEPEEPRICILSKDFLEENINSKEIKIDKDITHIEDDFFINCHNLSTIKVDEENKNFCSKLGVLFTKDMKKIIYYPPLKQTSTYFIPQGVEEINTHTFFNNNYLKYIIIPTSLNTINKNAFVNCQFMNQVVIPENVREIHPKAFNLCPRLTIRCYKNSMAEDFCTKYFIPFEYLTS